jgi:hypothetical protein
MRHSGIKIIKPVNEGSAPDDGHNARLLALADACFEMFSMSELRKPLTILNELSLSFPDMSRPEIFRAVRLALSWRRILRDAGEPVH